VIPNGTYVKHSTKQIQGRVVGLTRIKQLFERSDNAVEYRIQTAAGEIKICSETNLLPQVPDGRYSHCYRCGLQVDPNSVVCRKCDWFICADPDCHACGCNYVWF